MHGRVYTHGEQRVRTSKVVATGAVVAIMVGSVSLSTAAQAKAAGNGPASAFRGAHATGSPVSRRAHMGSYGTAKFAKDAARLPSGLAAQLRKQLGITPAQFLAEGQAAADAGKVVASLRAGGATVLGARLDGTSLTVTVPDAADAAAAEADGASAVIGGAQPAKTVTARAVSSPADGSSALLGGDLWAYQTNVSAGEGVICSTGFNGYAKSTGAREFLTAGHCADYQDTGEPAPADGTVYATDDTDPVTLDGGVQVAYPALGSLDQSSFHFGGGVDSGLVDVTDTQAKPEPAVNTWGSSGTGANASSATGLGVENSSSVPVLAAAAAVAGEPVCHSGESTGWQCGTVKSAAVPVDVQAATQTQEVDSIETTVCLLPGDSGGSFISGEYALGVASAGNFVPESGSGAGANTCATTGYSQTPYSYAYPMVAAASGEESVAQSEPGFELALTVSTPVVTTAKASGGTGDDIVVGHLPAPFATGTRVSLSLDGHARASTTADSNGNWSFGLTGLAACGQSYSVTAGSGHSTAAASGTLSIAPGNVTCVKAPGISGTVRVGSRVAANPGTWSVATPTFTYQWLGNGKPISGATSASYTVPASLAGAKLSVTVTAHQFGYSPAAKTSAASTVAKGIFALTVRPKLSGIPQVGKRLAVTTGTWSPAATIKIQWYASGKPVYRATGTTLYLTAALRGKTISVTVSAGKAGYVPAAVRLAESVRVR
jgi:hypothetical protein